MISVLFSILSVQGSRTTVYVMVDSGEPCYSDYPCQTYVDPKSTCQGAQPWKAGHCFYPQPRRAGRRLDSDLDVDLVENDRRRVVRCTEDKDCRTGLGERQCSLSGGFCVAGTGLGVAGEPCTFNDHCNTVSGYTCSSGNGQIGTCQKSAWVPAPSPWVPAPSPWVPSPSPSVWSCSGNNFGSCPWTKTCKWRPTGYTCVRLRIGRRLEGDSSDEDDEVTLDEAPTPEFRRMSNKPMGARCHTDWCCQAGLECAGGVCMAPSMTWPSGSCSGNNFGSCPRGQECVSTRSLPAQYQCRPMFRRLKDTE